MKLLPLSWKSLLNRRFSVLLTVLTIAISVGLLAMVERLRLEARQGFYRATAGTDLIVGARTSPVQLLLYSVFGLGDATNNITWESYSEITDSSMVAWAIPIALGDAHAGYRVVGTTEAMFEHFNYAGGRALEFSQGRPFDDLFDVVLGFEVARTLGYDLGDQIVVAHGTGRVSLQSHDDHPFTVAGVLAPTGTPVDRNLYISLAAHKAIHTGWESGVFRPGTGLSPEQARQAGLEPDNVTAILLGLTTRAAAFQLQRLINQYRAEPLTAILPGVALQELWRITALAERALLAVAVVVVVAGLLGLLTVLLTTMAERRREMAILRAVGARPWQIGALLVTEAGVITAAGIILGVALALGLQLLSAGWLLSRFGLYIGFAPPEGYQLLTLGVIFAAGLAIALVPAVMAYRRTLADGMQVRT